MTNPPLPSIELAESITAQLGQLRRHLAAAPPHEAAQLLAHVLDYDTGLLGEVTGLVETGSRFARVNSERGLLPPEVWLALGRASNELNSVGTDLHEYTGAIQKVAAPAVTSARPHAAPAASAMVMRRRR
ncbi:hypothetical protein ACGF7W_18510 [Streptomyces sp. NPDC048219]|uniref:hypothetical protein n=1 Tax=Streptomyces sp. NPDC048219 TaxID=3365517 RepID=UPI00371538D2